MVGTVIASRYHLTQKIGEGGMSYVYLADEKPKSSSPYALKILKQQTSSRRVEDIIRFHNEAKTVAALSHPNIIKIKEVGEFETGPDNQNHFIVMEYVHGKSLYQLLKEGRKFNEHESLELVKQICRALDYIHHQGIVHRDLKPANLLLSVKEQPDINSLKIIDFGLAQIRELTEIKEKEYISGTFSYMSPEQLGLIKKNIDERSDLYSLGIIFYQLITGQLPYQSDTVSSLAHMHTAKMPRLPSSLNKNLPKIIEKIILKLLEKEPENRYQSAKGLLSDIEKYQQGNTEFSPGFHDKIMKLNFRANLVGRNDELKILNTLLENAKNSKGGICFVGGEAGLGKTRLIEEFKSKALLGNILMLETKCFSGENKIPFGPFKEILDTYIHFLSRLPEEEKKAAKEKITLAAGEFYSLVLKMNSMFAEYLQGIKPAGLVELEAEKENQRFLNANAQFLLKLGQIHKPLVLFIDDLQWIDNSSMDLLKNIAQEISHYPILILASCRNNELFPSHPVSKLKQELSKHPQIYHEIELKPLDLGRMKNFISELLFENANDTGEIAEFILKKSSGNPYFSIEILKQLVDEKAVFFNQNKWEIDHHKMDHISIPLTLIDLILKKIPLLPSRMADILSHAAVIGKKFDIQFLFSLCPYSHTEIVQIVDQAIALQLLEQNTETKGGIIFVHDRIKEAFYQNLGTEKKKELHRKIAFLMETQDEETKEQTIFDLANHFIECGLTDKIIEYCRPAAFKAKSNFANEEAIYYFQQILSVLKSTRDDSEIIEISRLIADLYLTIGQNQNTIRVAQETFPLVKDKIQKAMFYKQICAAYYKQGVMEKAEFYGKEGLKLLGEGLPIKNFFVTVSIVKEFIKQLAHLAFPNIFTRKKENPDNVKAKLINSFYATLNWVYLIMDIVKFIRCELRMLNLTESKIGPSKELGMALANHGGLLMSIPLFKDSYSYLKKSIEIREKLLDRYGIAQSLESLGYYHMFKGELTESVQVLEKSINDFERMGDKKEAGMSYAALFYVYQLLSDYPKAKTINHQCFDVFHPMNDSHGLCLFYYNNSLLCLEQGFLDEALEWAGKNYELSLKEKNWFLHTGAIGLTGVTYLEKNQVHKAIELMEKARALDRSHKFLRQYMCLLYYYLADAYMEKLRIDNPAGKERKKLIRRINQATNEALKQSRKWPNHYAGALRSKAKYYSLTGNNKKAEQFFTQSIQHSKNQLRKYEEAKSLYEYGLFLKATHQKEKALEILEESYQIFQSIGAHLYIKKTSEALGIQQISSIQKMIDRQKLSSIIKVSQDISLILDLDILLEKIVSVILEVTGAQRGFFIIKNPHTGELEIKARKNVSQENEQDYSKSIVSQVFRTGEPILGANAEDEEKFNEYHSVAEYHLKSIICIPIRHKNEIKGVCYLDSKIIENLFSPDDLELLNVFTSQAAIAMENAQLHNEMLEKARLSKELEIAKDIQISMLPTIDNIPGYDISTYLRSASEISGDYYDFYALEEPFFGIFGDVAGHGLKSGLIMMMVDVAFNSIIKNKQMRQESLPELYQQMNSTLYENIQTRLFQKSKQGREYGALYSTLRLFRFDSKGNFEMFGNDHAQPFICRKDSGRIEPIKSTGMLLGMLKDAKQNYQPEAFILNPGDLLVFYSDGIIEAKMKGKQEIHKKEIHQYMFGEERFFEAVRKNRHLSSKEIIDTVLLTIDQWMKEQDDDMTMVVIKKK